MNRIKFKNRILASGCDLCGDNSQPLLHLHASCHMTAPLRAELADGVLTLYCYIPECNRVVAKFKLANAEVSERGPLATDCNKSDTRASLD